MRKIHLRPRCHPNNNERPISLGEAIVALALDTGWTLDQVMGLTSKQIQTIIKIVNKRKMRKYYEDFIKNGGDIKTLSPDHPFHNYLNEEEKNKTGWADKNMEDSSMSEKIMNERITKLNKGNAKEILMKDFGLKH